jgi:hypothetical protein
LRGVRCRNIAITLIFHIPLSSNGTKEMGADWVCLFDKRLCDEIISLASADIPAFVGSHLSALDDLSEFKCGFPPDVPASVRVTRLREQGRTDEELKADLVDHLLRFRAPTHR